MAPGDYLPSTPERIPGITPTPVLTLNDPLKLWVYTYVTIEYFSFHFSDSLLDDTTNLPTVVPSANDASMLCPPVDTTTGNNSNLHSTSEV